MQLVVVGTGLMGGSFALAARRAGLFERIVGVEPDADCARRALALGIVDEVADVVPPGADAVLLAGPSHTIAPWISSLWERSPDRERASSQWERSPDRERASSQWERSPDRESASSQWERSPDRERPAVIFDTASVKGAILDDIRATLGAVPARFVPCHPLTGSEQSGPDAADAALFEGAEVIVTPTSDTDADALDRVRAIWQAVGARIATMSAEEHDRVLALTSHLPHLLAFAYLQLVGEGDLEHTAGGFRDFTRIGASDAEMWAPILRLNRQRLLAALERMEGELQRVRELMAGAEQGALVEYLRSAARRRGGDR